MYGFEQKDSQGFENSYNSYEQYPLEKFFIFTFYQNYTLALKGKFSSGIEGALALKLNRDFKWNNYRKLFFVFCFMFWKFILRNIVSEIVEI